MQEKIFSHNAQANPSVHQPMDCMAESVALAESVGSAALDALCKFRTERSTQIRSANHLKAKRNM
jgi:hypothetical protein